MNFVLQRIKKTQPKAATLHYNRLRSLYVIETLNKPFAEIKNIVKALKMRQPQNTLYITTSSELYTTTLATLLADILETESK
jgi:predicted aconitase